MTKPQMTFHESYGDLPVKTLRLIKRHNVSPADFDYMTDVLGMVAYNPGTGVDWSVLDKHILENSGSGMYQPRFF